MRPRHLCWSREREPPRPARRTGLGPHELLKRVRLVQRSTLERAFDGLAHAQAEALALAVAVLLSTTKPSAGRPSGLRAARAEPRSAQRLRALSTNLTTEARRQATAVPLGLPLLGGCQFALVLLKERRRDVALVRGLCGDDRQLGLPVAAHVCGGRGPRCVEAQPRVSRLRAFCMGVRAHGYARTLGHRRREIGRADGDHEADRLDGPERSRAPVVPCLAGPPRSKSHA